MSDAPNAESVDPDRHSPRRITGTGGFILPAPSPHDHDDEGERA